MRIDIATLFPEMCEAVLSTSIIGRARKAGFIEVYCHNIRDFSEDKHQRVDAAPYGGGNGMLMQADPIFKCYEHVCEESCSKPFVIYMSPQGAVLNQKLAVDFAEKYEHLFLICGHYEGIDERIIEEIVDMEVSIGDYVLTGGELGALVLTDAVGRLCDGVLSEDVCFEDESHYSGLLEYPQYTRPQIWHGRGVPEVLLSGNHKLISDWRHEQAVKRTMEKRPDMLKKEE
ncbi:MAG: tRNA (guanosine(37)-N1)-methyltransferase TrmD [Oscillospiraceae bacterium]|nr:tRNA (guanosine(37)-N1)-methyltransferase TrmD [Oscillospiraceae bacterium]MBQ8595033.1 tRNA (guanosine(37)-N1)-methyltransferase TrmD [Oscillospiraceae bacterium]